MWWPGSAEPLHIEPGPSRWLTAYLLGVHAAALVLLAGWIRPAWLATGLAAVVLWRLAVNWRRHVQRRGERVVVRAVWHADGRWVLETAAGSLAARLERDAFVHPLLVVLNFRTPQGRHVLILFRDAVPEAVHRRLRVRLRVEGP